MKISKMKAAWRNEIKEIENKISAAKASKSENEISKYNENESEKFISISDININNRKWLKSESGILSASI